MFLETFKKLLDGVQLSTGEKDEINQEIRNIQNVESLVSSWVSPGSSIPFIPNLRTSNIFISSGEIRLGSGTPGQSFSGVRIGYPAFTYSGQDWNIAGINNDVLQVGIRASDGKFIAGGGGVVIDSAGITLSNLSGLIQFLAPSGGNGTRLYGDIDSYMVMQNDHIGGGIRLDQILTNGIGFNVFIKENPSTNNMGKIDISLPINGAVMAFGSAVIINAGTTTAGSNYIVLAPTFSTPPTPANTGYGVAPQIYVSGSKIVFQFEEGGTVRYKYLDLSGTGVTWVHQTTPP
jgi:hypothetical protein